MLHRLGPPSCPDYDWIDPHCPSKDLVSEIPAIAPRQVPGTAIQRLYVFVRARRIVGNKNQGIYDAGYRDRSRQASDDGAGELGRILAIRVSMVSQQGSGIGPTVVPKIFVAIENVALQQQLAICRQSVKRPKLRSRNRIFWVWISRLWCSRQSALIIVQPETVIRWHRQGIKLSKS